MKRVAFYIWSLGVGGAERHTIDLATRLAEHGCIVKIFVHDGPLGLDAHASPIEIVQLNAGGFSSFPQWRRAWRAIENFGPDALFTVNLSATFCAIVGQLQRRFSMFLIMHSTTLWRKAEIARAMFVAVNSRGFTTIFCSEKQRKYWISRGFRGNTIAIYNGVDIQRFSAPSPSERALARHRLGLTEEDYVIGMVAAFRREKNHSAIIAALGVLLEKGINATLVLVGDGPLRKEVENTACLLNGRVLFAGNQDDVRPFLAAMDVGVICSTSVETFSIAALEAMSSGLPMVMTDIGGASEMLIDGKTGILVAPGDVGALVDALVLLHDLPRRRIFGSRARLRVANNFTDETMVDKYMRLLE